jgi:hypothetical protein
LFLFLEIAFIRWISGYVKIVAYFTNIILISAFLGGGIGLLIKKRKYINYFPAIILLLIAAVFSYQILYASYIDLNITPDIDTLTETGLESKTVSEKSFLAKVLLPEGEWIWGTSTFLIYVVPFFFFLNALIFIPIGQLLGEKMKKFPPLKAYTIDISGSLAGIFALSALSFFLFSLFGGFCLDLSFI